MSFQFENVILPDGPVVLVNRGWRVSGPKSKVQSRAKLNSAHVGTFETFKIERPPDVQRCRKQAKQSRSGKPLNVSKAKERLSMSTATNEIQAKSVSQLNEEPFARNIDSFEVTRRSTIPPLETDKADEQVRIQYLSSPIVDAPLARLCTFRVPEPIVRMHYLDYYIERIGNLLYPLHGRYTIDPVREAWLPIILTDETWFFTTLYSVARHLTAMDKGKSNWEVDYLADTVLRKFRKKIEDNTKGEKPTDSFCCSVACMVAIEQNFGSPESSNSHAKGLAELLKVRGGIENISSFLRTKIWRADIDGAIDHLRKPLFDPPTTMEHDFKTPSYLLPVAHFLLHPSYDSVLSHQHLRLATISVELLAFTSYLDQQLSSGQLLDPFKLDNDVLIIEHRLCLVDQDGFNDLDCAFRLACLIFLKCLMRPIDFIPVTSTKLVESLFSYWIRLDDGPQCLKLWISYMCIIAGGWLTPARLTVTDWIITKYRDDEGALPPWSEIRKRLKSVLWVDELYDTTGAKLWREVGALASA